MVTFRQILVQILFILIAISSYPTISLSAPSNPPGNPVVQGAWLYQGKCVGCHGSYKKARLAEDHEGTTSLMSAIGNLGCQIAWSRSKGGELSMEEIRAITSYFLEWEENGADPEIPPLPQPDDKQITSHKVVVKEKTTLPTNNSGKLSAPLQHVVDTFPVAAGGWLYTRNCYRCHLKYDNARMGRGVASDSVFRFISEGKTSTQMKPFARMLGGELKNSQIKSIVAYIMTWEKFGEPPEIAQELMTPPAQDPADFVPLRLIHFKTISGNHNPGKKLYTINCLSCHGSHGEGYIGAKLMGSKWCLRKDLFVKSIVKNGIPHSPMRGWSRGAGGPFSAKDIDDIVSYVIETMATIDN